MIYRLTDDYINTCSLLIDNIELATKMPTFRPKFFATPKQKEWVVPEASFHYSENYKGSSKITPDVTVWTIGVLAFSPKAYDVFHELLAKAVKLLQVSVCGETYYLALSKGLVQIE